MDDSFILYWPCRDFNNKYPLGCLALSVNIHLVWLIVFCSFINGRAVIKVLCHIMPNKIKMPLPESLNLVSLDECSPQVLGTDLGSREWMLRIALLFCTLALLLVLEIKKSCLISQKSDLETEEISYKLSTPSFDRHFFFVRCFLLSIYINMTLMRQSRLLFSYQRLQ